MENCLGIVAHDYLAICNSFCDQLTRSARGEITSLPFVRNRLPKVSAVQPGEIFQVFVVGGTNCETARIRFNTQGGAAILEHTRCPEVAKFRTVDDFLDFITAHVGVDARVIALNFGFALTPVASARGVLDGIMVGNDTKDHCFRGLVRQKVGAMIENHFRITQGRKVTVCVGNDTVCLALSAAARDIDPQSMAAGVVGTGYNLALFLDEYTVVNIQACDFVSDDAPGISRKQLYRTEVSGGELYKRYNELAEKYALGELDSSKDLAALAASDKGNGGALARALFERSASLVAAQLAGLYNFKGKPARLSVVMQGGVFWDGPGYKEMVRGRLDRLGIPSEAIAFKKVKHADIVGAAKLATGGF